MELDELIIEDLVGAYPTCPHCAATEVRRDAWLEWSLLTREWIIASVFETFACASCQKDIIPAWKIDKLFRTRRIRRLNDALRRGEGEIVSIVVTSGIQAKGEDFLARLQAAVAGYDEFSEDNDPHKEHDFGAITLNGEKLFWKIDYFDLAMERHSPDPANPYVTHRVLTIMLADEY